VRGGATFGSTRDASWCPHIEAASPRGYAPANRWVLCQSEQASAGTRTARRPFPVFSGPSTVAVRLHPKGEVVTPAGCAAAQRAGGQATALGGSAETRADDWAAGQRGLTGWENPAANGGVIAWAPVHRGTAVPAATERRSSDRPARCPTQLQPSDARRPSGPSDEKRRSREWPGRSPLLEPRRSRRVADRRRARRRRPARAISAAGAATITARRQARRPRGSRGQWPVRPRVRRAGRLRASSSRPAW
jgi:hypothetical protein